MVEKPDRRLNAERIWTYALRLLGGRAYSTGELREKLRRRALHEADVDNAVARLKDLGYLDDRRFAESFAAARLSGDKHGSTRVVQDLRRRRVAPKLAETTVRAVYDGVNETALIEDWVRRKYRTAVREGLFEEDKDMASAYRRLLHAGFKSGDIVRVLKRFAKNPDLLDAWEPPEPEAEAE
jgi:regulatory protein